MSIAERGAVYLERGNLTRIDWAVLDPDVVTLILDYMGPHAWVARMASRRFRDAAPGRPMQVLVSAATSIDHAQLALDLELVKPNALCREAAARGRIDTLEWLERTSEFFGELSREMCGRHVCHSAERILAAAARGGQLPVLEWFKTRLPYVRGNRTRAAAARGGSIAVLEWLTRDHTREPVDRDVRLDVLAARGGHAHVVDWCIRISRRPVIDELTCVGAASGGHVDMLKWLCDRRCRCSLAQCRFAGRAQPSVLEWLDAQKHSETIY